MSVTRELREDGSFELEEASGIELREPEDRASTGDSVGSRWTVCRFTRKRWEELKRELLALQEAARSKAAKKEIGQLRTDLAKQAERAPFMSFAGEELAFDQAQSMVDRTRQIVASPDRLVAQLASVAQTYHVEAQRLREQDDEEDLEFLLLH